MDIGTVGKIASNVPSTPSNSTSRQAYTVQNSMSTRQSAPVQTQTTSAVGQTSASPTLDQVKQAVQDLNQSMSELSHGLEFSVDDTRETNQPELSGKCPS